MKAVCWYGTKDVRVETAPDPVIQDPRDIVIRVTASGICGSDLHLVDGFMPSMKKGDVLGHEPMGIVEEVGSAIKNLRKGDRVVVPFNIACGDCFFCEKTLFGACDRSNTPEGREISKKALGHHGGAAFGYSHMTGGFPGGQAEYLRVPFADVGAFKIESDIEDEQVLFLSDILPTGYMAAENCEMEPGDTVAVWGCGPVGQFCIQCAWLFGAGRVIAIDRVPERLEMARRLGRAEVLNMDDGKIPERLDEMTQGRGPDRCIDAVGAEAHGMGALDAVMDNLKAKVNLATDRAHALREAIMCCRKAGTVSVPGVYIGLLDNVPFGAAMNKGLTIKTGQTHVRRYMQPLFELIGEGKIRPASIITHRIGLDEAPALYKTFRDKKDGCIKVVIKPHG
ncbi:MAG: glutathione-dependent formaldehyde dehydrogenase [Pyrinomonadaceae bacterium]|nr:glutathione-dependent formaldehyde dehydrogenase [Phycisphaerales bacterium]